MKLSRRVSRSGFACQWWTCKQAQPKSASTTARLAQELLAIRLDGKRFENSPSGAALQDIGWLHIAVDDPRLDNN